jgi:hypothetical protein
MPTTQQCWLKLTLTAQAGRLFAASETSAGHRSVLRDTGITLGTVVEFGGDIEKNAVTALPLSEEQRQRAFAIYSAIFVGEVADNYSQILRDAQKAEERLLLGLIVDAPELAGIPWEALWNGSAHLGLAPELVVVRLIAAKSANRERRAIEGPVRILLIAPVGTATTVSRMEALLQPKIDAGEIELLEPIIGDSTQRTVLERLLRTRYVSKAPNVVHFIGHGAVHDENGPLLELGSTKREWVQADMLQRELSAQFVRDMRLVVLESCEGAAQHHFRSAASGFAETSCYSLAHFWPVRSDVARDGAKIFYETLCAGTSVADGDVGPALNATRRTLFESYGCAAWSLVLVMRDVSLLAFDFGRRRLVKPDKNSLRPPANVDPRLGALFKRRFSFFLGDRDHEAAGRGRRLLREALLEKLRRKLIEDFEELAYAELEEKKKEFEKAHANLTLSALAQRFVLQFDSLQLRRLTQQLLISELNHPTFEPPTFVKEVARRLRPGVHATLLWLPSLELALAEAHEESKIYVVEPPPLNVRAAPRILCFSEGTWTSVDDFDFDDGTDYVVLRLYGGLLPGGNADGTAFTAALITEDDHIDGLRHLGEWSLLPDEDEGATVMGFLRSQPTLVVGASLLKWRHRALIRWLFGDKTPPKPSMAVIPHTADLAEERAWSSAFTAMDQRSGLSLLRANADELGSLVAMLAGGG